MQTTELTTRAKALCAKLRKLCTRAKAALPSRSEWKTVARGSDVPAKLRRTHFVYLGAIGTLLGYAIGFVTLLLAAYSCSGVPFGAMVGYYLTHPLLLLLNLLPAVLLLWLFAFAAGRLWAGVALSGGVSVALAIVQHYKILLRGDPLTLADLRLVRTMGGIIARYDISPTGGVVLAVLALAGLIALSIKLKGFAPAPKLRLCGAALTLVLALALQFGLYTNEGLYDRFENDDLINPWSAAEDYTLRGFLYPLLHSAAELYEPPVTEYSSEAAADILAEYSDADIPEDERVTVMGVMLEAFCDLTDFPTLAKLPGVAAAYAPWHALEENSISGDLITDIFAGGTVESEWAFLTGSSRRDVYTKPIDSYVRYFNAQGYDTHYAHPGHDWFYERRSVNGYLGFDESFFAEDGFADLVDPYVAAWHSDKQLVDYLLSDLDGAEGAPRFSFAVSYQNHGPYSGGGTSKDAFFSAAESGLSEESCDILNAYLYGVSESILEYVRLAEELNARETPVVLVLFGDHKPWLGNDYSVYREMGVSFDFSTLTGLKNYHATPYLIWANDAAKEVLGADFTGAGGDFSPCFLMPRLFDACGWEGSGFMQLAREIRAVTPLLHTSGLYMVEGNLTTALSEEGEAVLERYQLAQAYREYDFVDNSPPKPPKPPKEESLPPPVAPQPVIPVPVDPYTVTPDANDPYAINPDADDPYAVAPDTDDPYAVQPDTDDPYGVAPDTDDPYAIAPDAEAPYVTAPDTQSPDAPPTGEESGAGESVETSAPDTSSTPDAPPAADAPSASADGAEGKTSGTPDAPVTPEEPPAADTESPIMADAA